MTSSSAVPASGEQHEITAGSLRAVVTEVGGALRSLTVDGRDLVVPFGDGWFRVTTTVSGITDGTAGHTGIVNDQTSDRGVMQVRNLVINGVAVLPPSNKDQCKNGGWQLNGYKNQGACVSSFAKAK